MDELKEKIIKVVNIAGSNISESQLQIIDRGVPHQPSGLTKGNFGIYSFEYDNEFLKVGKVGQNSDRDLEVNTIFQEVLKVTWRNQF